MADAKTECEALLEFVLPFAEQMLRQHGEFFPFGAAMRPDGQIAATAGYTGTEQPPSSEVIALLQEGFVNGARSGDYKATALVYDAKVTLPSSDETSDAIVVSLNHHDNYSIVVVFPYRLKEGALVMGEAFANAGNADVFSVR